MVVRALARETPSPPRAIPPAGGCTRPIPARCPCPRSILISSLTASRRRWMGSVTLSCTSSARRMRSSVQSRAGARLRRRQSWFLPADCWISSQAVSTFSKNLSASLRISATSFTALPLRKRGEQALFRARIPQPVQRITHCPLETLRPMCREATLLHPCAPRRKSRSRS